MYSSCRLLHNGGGHGYRQSGGERGRDVQRDGTGPMRGGVHVWAEAVGGLLQKSEGAEAVPLRLHE